MTEWETILFIGGPADGMNLRIPPNRQDYAIAKPESLEPDMSLEGFYSIAPPQVKLQYVLYHRIYLHGRHDPCSVMAAEGIDEDGVMERLMLYYRPPELDKEKEWR